jgi:hypothetical protein
MSNRTGHLSESAIRLLELIRPDGGKSNVGPLREALGASPSDFESAKNELIAADLVQLVGRGRLARVVSQQVLTTLSSEARSLYGLLPPDGSFIGNIRLRSLPISTTQPTQLLAGSFSIPV